MAALQLCLHDLGWNSLLPNSWINPDGETWTISGAHASILHPRVGHAFATRLRGQVVIKGKLPRGGMWARRQGSGPHGSAKRPGLLEKNREPPRSWRPYHLRACRYLD